MFVPWIAIADGTGGAQLHAWDPRLLWGTVVLCFALLLAAVCIALFSRWRKRAARSRPASGDQLAEFRVLYEKGGLSRAEFESIRTVLGHRIRKELDLPAPEEKHHSPNPLSSRDGKTADDGAPGHAGSGDLAE